MKKLIYILLLTVASAASFTACTEEEVTPSTQNTGTGGGTQIPDGGN